MFAQRIDQKSAEGLVAYRPNIETAQVGRHGHEQPGTRQHEEGVHGQGRQQPDEEPCYRTKRLAVRQALAYHHEVPAFAEVVALLAQQQRILSIHVEPRRFRTLGLIRCPAPMVAGETLFGPLPLPPQRVVLVRRVRFRVRITQLVLSGEAHQRAETGSQVTSARYSAEVIGQRQKPALSQFLHHAQAERCGSDSTAGQGQSDKLRPNLVLVPLIFLLPLLSRLLFLIRLPIL